MDILNKDITFAVAKADPVDTPVLLSFPSGLPNESEEMDLTLWKKKSGNKVKQRVALEVEGVTYIGADYGLGGSSLDCCNYAVGMFDRGSNIMTVIPAHHPFAMNIVPLVDTSTNAVSTMTSWERRNALTESFGSRKRKRAVKAAESNVISIENIAGASVVKDNMVEYVESNGSEQKPITAAEVALSEQRLIILPRFNELATELDEAYPMEHLIPQELRTVLTAAYEQKVQQSAELSGDSAWILHFFPNISGDYLRSLIPNNIVQHSAKHRKTAKMRTSGLMYLNYLLNFYILANSRTTVSRSDALQALGCPEEVMDHIACNFAISKKIRKEDAYQRNKQMSQKLMLHALALALHFGDFQINLTLLAQDLKSSVAAVQTLARALGCSPLKRKVDGNEISIAELRLPLKFPEPSKGKK